MARVLARPGCVLHAADPRRFNISMGALWVHIWRIWCTADGTGQPASLQTRTIASLVSKYTCQ